MNKLTTLKSLQNVTKSVRKCADVRSHIAHLKKCRTHAHRTHVPKCFSHAHRTCASVRAHVRVRIFFRNSQFEKELNEMKINLGIPIHKLSHSCELMCLSLRTKKYVVLKLRHL